MAVGTRILKNNEYVDLKGRNAQIGVPDYLSTTCIHLSALGSCRFLERGRQGWRGGGMGC